MSKIIQVADLNANELSLENAKSQVLFHKGEVFTFFDEGCTRYVYTNADNTLVIKFPKTHCDHFNIEENEIYQNADDEKRTKLASTILINGLIEQEFCTPIKFGGKKLSIAQRLFAGQCRNEVGWNKDGELVCFDLDEYMKY